MPQLIRALAPACDESTGGHSGRGASHPAHRPKRPIGEDIESSAAFNRRTQCARLSIERRDDARHGQCVVPARVSVR